MRPSCVWRSDRPDGQTCPPQSGVAHGFSLIPFSGVGVVVDEVKTDRNAENSETPRSDMVSDGMTFEKHSHNIQPLQVNLNALCDVQHATRTKVRMRAYNELLSAHLPSRSWKLPLSGREKLLRA